MIFSIRHTFEKNINDNIFENIGTEITDYEKPSIFTFETGILLGIGIVGIIGSILWKKYK